MCGQKDQPLIVLTGASGALGRPVHRALLEAGKEVRAVDWKAPLPGELPIVQADLLDAEACRAVIEGARVLIHLAYQKRGGAPTEETLEEHFRLNRRVFMAALEAGVEKIIFSSSIQVVAVQRPDFSADFPPRYLPLDEHSVPEPDNWYSLAKRCSEELLAMLHRVHGLDSVIFRFPYLAVQAPREGEQLCAGRRSEAFSYLTFRDAADVMLRASEVSLPGCRIYLPASRKNGLGRPVPELIREFFPGVALRRPAEEMESLVDLSALARDLGWEPRDRSEPGAC